jgi:hypothetical protein
MKKLQPGHTKSEGQWSDQQGHGEQPAEDRENSPAA